MFMAAISSDYYDLFGFGALISWPVLADNRLVSGNGERFALLLRQGLLYLPEHRGSRLYVEFFVSFLWREKSHPSWGAYLMPQASNG